MKSKQETIKMINDSPSSIFTKEDLLRIISDLEAPKGVSMSLEQIEDIASEIARRISSSDDICELDSVTVSVGGYGNGVDDASFTMDEDEISSIVQCVLEDYITPTDEDSAATENNSVDNQ